MEGFISALRKGNANPLAEALGKASRAGETPDTIDGLSLTHNITDDDLIRILEAVRDSTLRLHHVSLPNNFIGDAGVTALSWLLKGHSISHLDLHGNNIGPKGCQMLCDTLANDTFLRHLDLSWNPLSREGGLQIAEMLRANVTLESLQLRKTQMTEAGVIAILATLRCENTTVRELHIGGQPLVSRQEVVAHHVSQMLVSNGHLVSLGLAGCRIGDDGAMLLKDALVNHPSMRHLNLAGNSIGIAGGECLAYLLLAQQELETLDLSANSLGNDGAKAFKPVLEANTTLKSLDLRSNSVEDEGLSLLAEGLEGNATLQSLKIWGNTFGQQSLQAFAQLQEGRFALVGIYLDIRPYIVDDTWMVAQEAPPA